MTIEELRKSIEEKTKAVRGFLKENKAEDAKKAMEELRGLKEKLKIAEELEQSEKEDLENQRDNKRGRSEKTNEMRAITKYVMGEELSKEERAVVNSVGNSAIIPKEFVNNLIEIQKGYGSLKELCDIIPANRNEGSIPIVDLDQNELKDIAEGEDIVGGDLVTKDVSYKCQKVGLLQTISSETIEDAVIDIENLVKKNFANIATIKENQKILKIIINNAKNVEGATSYEDVEKAIDESLPSVKAGLVTLTNVTTYANIKNKKDANGRNLDLITVINGAEYFHGKPIVTVENEMLPVATEGKTDICYIGNIKEAVKFIDRKQVTIAKSEEAGFENDTTKLRILERIDAILGSARSIKRIEFANDKTPKVEVQKIEG